jgi:hypothetical protein
VVAQESETEALPPRSGLAVSRHIVFGCFYQSTIRDTTWARWFTTSALHTCIENFADLIIDL